MPKPIDPTYILYEDNLREQNTRVLGALLRSIMDVEMFYYSRGAASIDNHESTLYALYDLDDMLIKLLRDATSPEATTIVEDVLKETTRRAEYERKKVTDSAGD